MFSYLLGHCFVGAESKVHTFHNAGESDSRGDAPSAFDANAYGSQTVERTSPCFRGYGNRQLPRTVSSSAHRTELVFFRIQTLGCLPEALDIARGTLWGIAGPTENLPRLVRSLTRDEPVASSPW